MTRLAMIFGLMVLFGLGYAGIERIGLADARIHSIRAARANAHLASIVGELEWAATLERMRGIAQSSADDLTRKWPPSGELAADVLRAELATVLDRAGGQGTVAVFDDEGRRVASVSPPGSAELDGSTRPVEDARTGALTAQLVGGATAPSIVAAAPLPGRRVIAVSIPFDRRLIAPWVQAEGPAGELAIVGANGELIASTIDTGLPARIPRGTFNLDIAERPHAAAARPLNDDVGTVGAFVGLSPYDVVLIEAVVKRLRLVYGALAALAIALAVFASFFIGGRAPVASRAHATAPTGARDEAWDNLAAEASSSNTSRGVTADHLMAAARVLDGSGPLPAVRHSESLNAPPPPLRYSAAPPDGPSMPPGQADRQSWGPGTPVGQGQRGVQLPNTSMAPQQRSAPSHAPSHAAMGGSMPPMVASMTPGVGSARPVAPSVAAALGPTYGRGMSPAPPAVATGAPPYPGPMPGGSTRPVASSTPAPAAYAATGTFAGYTPLPMLEEDPDYTAAQARLAQVAADASTPRRSTSSEVPAASLGQPRAFDEEHYRGAFDEFVGSKRRLGEPVETVSFEGFKNKLRKIEQTLIEKHGCRAVRFQVVVRDRQVSLRPQLVR